MMKTEGSAKRHQFGNNCKVSLFTLGTMRAINSSEQMYEVVKSAYSIGINHIETAPSYGQAESFLGNAISRLSQEEGISQKWWVITSKLLPGINLEQGQKELLGILKRIGLKRIDNIAIHGLNKPEHLKWILEGEGSKIIEWAKDERLINQVGFSSHGSYSTISKAIESKFFQFCSLHLHMFEPSKIPLAKLALEQKMGVMAISPADKGGHLHSPSQMLLEDCHPIRPIELAYRFLLSKKISTLTIGASKPKDLEIAQKLISADGPLSTLEINTLKKIQRNKSFRLGDSNCGQCRSCLPCPQNVPIPELLRLRNLLIGHGLESYTKERYNLIGKAGHWWEEVNASACQSCGKCLPLCPNHLPIPDLLKETHDLLSESPRRRLWG